MINKKTKQKLLKELEKIGNVLMACLKCGINRSTFYRWKKNDPSFKTKAEALIRYGKENMCDIAEHCLVRKMKEGDVGAIKYALSHNSSRYKQKQTRKVIIEHRRQPEEPIADKPKMSNKIEFVSFAEREDEDAEELNKVINEAVSNDPSLLDPPALSQDEQEADSETHAPT